MRSLAILLRLRWESEWRRPSDRPTGGLAAALGRTHCMGHARRESVAERASRPRPGVLWDAPAG